MVILVLIIIIVISVLIAYPLNEAGGLILESTRGTGEAHPCKHEKLMKILSIGGRGLRGVSLLILSSCSSKQLAQATWPLQV